MELKWGLPPGVPSAKLRSNRTFMELKWRKGSRILFGNLVLIVPLWN